MCSAETGGGGGGSDSSASPTEVGDDPVARVADQRAPPGGGTGRGEGAALLLRLAGPLAGPAACAVARWGRGGKRAAELGRQWQLGCARPERERGSGWAARQGQAKNKRETEKEKKRFLIFQKGF